MLNCFKETSNKVLLNLIRVDEDKENILKCKVMFFSKYDWKSRC
jgi:hypothetical protein